ncbi:hypothetical protein Sta7437_3045 [Stanieria cyanosphaera PCC 7437]|uniref:Uncharacterized protein n=1 Tax=Stanieria cyanosphaera (strain ATCC 29371 / PCC 7437) TaxID=111780 RepID=K9XWW7_STAC7|nr:hypothetical protein [Stanieria cyanosphaera]AFZ36559.1 hypothetical protein Sta7437_3045 [Stanieria cyanosphaera PCC 7437]
MLSSITWEIRWFQEGQIPSEVEHWFKEDCLGNLDSSPETRIDRYLFLPEYKTVNLKLREENLELKTLQAQLEERQFAQGCWHGKIEQWTKWVYRDLTQQKIIPIQVARQRPWLSIYKKRQQRYYKNISAEITQLCFGNSLWWSLAFEMANIESQQYSDFCEGVELFSQFYPGSCLSREQSYSYPYWLSQLDSQTTLCQT